MEEAKRNAGIYEHDMQQLRERWCKPSRRNHAAETAYSSREFTGNAWRVNTTDITHVPNAAETYQAHRWRFIYMRCRMVPTASLVDAANKPLYATS